jgi:hypothetical protein
LGKGQKNPFHVGLIEDFPVNLKIHLRRFEEESYRLLLILFIIRLFFSLQDTKIYTICMNRPKIYNFGVGDLVTTRPSPNGGPIPYEALQDMYYVPMLRRDDESELEYISTKEDSTTDKSSKTKCHVTKSSSRRRHDDHSTSITHRRTHRSNNATIKIHNNSRSYSERTIRLKNKYTTGIGDSTVDTQRRSTSCPSYLLKCQHHVTETPISSKEKSTIKQSSKSNSLTIPSDTTIQTSTSDSVLLITKEWQHLAVDSSPQSRRLLLDKKSTRKPSTVYRMESIIHQTRDMDFYANRIKTYPETTIQTMSSRRRPTKPSSDYYSSILFAAPPPPPVSTSSSSNLLLYSTASSSAKHSMFSSIAPGA